MEPTLTCSPRSHHRPGSRLLRAQGTAPRTPAPEGQRHAGPSVQRNGRAESDAVRQSAPVHLLVCSDRQHAAGRQEFGVAALVTRGWGSLTGGLGQPHHCAGPPGPSNEAGPAGMARVTAPSAQSSRQRAQGGALLPGTKPPPAPAEHTGLPHGSHMTTRESQKGNLVKSERGTPSRFFSL